MGRARLALNGLRAFEAVARCGSFKDAANDLHVTQGAVSQQVATLEEIIGTKLISREYRGLRLTEQGNRLFPLLTAAFDMMEQGVRDIQITSESNTTLRFEIPPTFAARWLVLHLPAFLDSNPDLTIQITTTFREIDHRREDIDFSIRLGNGGWNDLDELFLFNEVLLPVAATSYLKDKNILHLSDLKKATLLHSLNRLSDWERWLSAEAVEGVDSRSGLRFGNSALAYQAALEGVGIALAQETFVSRELASGQLVAPFPGRLKTGLSYYLVYRRSDKNLSKISAFRDWAAKLVSSRS